MTTRVGIVVLAAVAVGLLSATTQSRSRANSSDDLASTVEQMMDALTRLETRVEKLEGLASVDAPNYFSANDDMERPRSQGGSTPSRIMVLDSIEIVEQDPDSNDELERLRTEVDALERSVDQMQDRVRSSSGYGGGGSYGRGSKNTSSSRRRRAEGQTLSEYQSKLRDKRGELKRLERDLGEPRQIVLGHWDGLIITLTSTRDVSRTLDRIEPGEHLTWSGRRVRLDGASQEWVISSVEKVDAADVPQEG